MSNLLIYNNVRTVPKEALKEIQAGRLKGKSDINPMWRIKVLTEQFGVCGFGWRYEITKQWIEKSDNGEIAAFVNIDLYIKQGGEWSEAIPGNGGSMFVAQENKGPYVSDECFKMALTDAISVSCKALGVGADVYWDKDSTKYSAKPQNDLQDNKPVGNDNNKPEGQQGGKNDSSVISEPQAKRMFAISHGNSKEEKADTVRLVLKSYGYEKSTDVKKADYEKICKELETMPF
jgi:hypothetical protein